jgi:hypothetical protein
MELLLAGQERVVLVVVGKAEVRVLVDVGIVVGVVVVWMVVGWVDAVEEAVLLVL